MMMVNDDERYEIRHPAIEKLLTDIGHLVGGAVSRTDPNFGFCLFLFSLHGHPGGPAMFYISNAHREDLLEALGEFIAKQREAR